MALNRPNSGLPTLLVWDSEEPAPQGDWVTVLWKGYRTGGAAEVSIPQRVEEQADALRARYLRWIHDLGEARVGEKRLLERLSVRPGFSYWWMTLLAEKSSDESVYLYDAVKLLALEDVASAHAAGTVILASSDRTLVRAFRAWCANAKLAFQWRRLPKPNDPVSLARRVYRSLPHPVQAMAYLLRYLKQRWPLRRTGMKALSGTTGRVTFCSYLACLDMAEASQGRFHSGYWTALPGSLAHDGIPTNWIHLYVHDEPGRGSRERDLIGRFSQEGAGAQWHSALDDALSWRVITDALRDYFRVGRMGARLRGVRRRFRPANSTVDLWPLFKRDWRSSMYGSKALSNCLLLNLIERVLAALPRQELGLYLQEHQGWETAWVHCWKASGHGTLVGVPHTCINFWDLRFFSDAGGGPGTGRSDMPMPEIVALNGPAAMAACRGGGYPEDAIVEVEALRFLYLAERPRVQNIAGNRSGSPLRVLVLTDSVPSATHRQLQWLQEAAPSLPASIRCVVRPHPYCPVRAGDYPGLPMQLTDTPLSVLLGDCDVAYTSNTTNAAVDAYCMGVPVVSVLDGQSFNMSPLRGLAEGVRFVRSPQELAEVLSGGSPAGRGSERQRYFTVDPALPRWKALLSRIAPGIYSQAPIGRTV